MKLPVPGELLFPQPHACNNVSRETLARIAVFDQEIGSERPPIKFAILLLQRLFSENFSERTRLEKPDN
jgi:hypothetical protein